MCIAIDVMYTRSPSVIQLRVDAFRISMSCVSELWVRRVVVAVIKSILSLGVFTNTHLNIYSTCVQTQRTHTHTFTHFYALAANVCDQWKIYDMHIRLRWYTGNRLFISFKWKYGVRKSTIHSSFFFLRDKNTIINNDNNSNNNKQHQTFHVLEI